MTSLAQIHLFQRHVESNDCLDLKRFASLLSVKTLLDGLEGERGACSVMS